jgi:hypothetical protein
MIHIILKDNPVMTSTHTQIKVVGLYSPKANKKAFEQFIRQYIDDADPANFNEGTVAIFKRLNREIVPYNDDDKQNLRDDLNHGLGKAVYVELLVEQPDQNFVMIDFYQQDPMQKEGYGQVAWNEAYI